MYVRSLLQSFALDNDGKVRSVEEVTRGLACDCVCPACLGRVIARQGDVREWHFAHESGVDCPHAAETALHKAAKQLVVETGGLMLPEQSYAAEVRLPDGRSGEGESVRPSMWIDFASAQQEACIGDVRPDVLAVFGTEHLAIEIAVTHFVDEEKLERLCALSIPTVEIGLAEQLGLHWSWETLRQLVIDDIKQKRWLLALERRTLEQEAHAIAMRRALSVPAWQTQVTTRRPATRKRHIIGGRIVDVVLLPFGAAVWAPYDPTINQLIKSVVYPLGGQWRPKFKNWLVPLEGRELLEAQLARLSDLPPTTIQK